jgi:hypothetical protein
MKLLCTLQSKSTRRTWIVVVYSTLFQISFHAKCPRHPTLLPSYGESKNTLSILHHIIYISLSFLLALCTVVVLNNGVVEPYLICVCFIFVSSLQIRI